MYIKTSAKATLIITIMIIGEYKPSFWQLAKTTTSLFVKKVQFPVKITLKSKGNKLSSQNQNNHLNQQMLLYTFSSLNLSFPEKMNTIITISTTSILAMKMKQ
jgi:hypothetical protein